jgi:hypothetical protein
MKNTLIVKKELISDSIIEILKLPGGVASVEVINNGHSYIINFNPNKEEIEKYKIALSNNLQNKGVNPESIDKIIEGIILASLSTFYSKVYSALMSEILNSFTKENLGTKFTISDLMAIVK